MMGISDTYILPIVGYRGWVVRDGKLSSCVVDNFWRPRKANVAQCGGYKRTKIWGAHALQLPELITHESYMAPVAECGCGFYAFKTLPYLLNWLEERREPHMVVGEVYLWGKLVECQYGYRAQYAYPKRFYSNEYNSACSNSISALREFDVPLDPMPETVAPRASARPLLQRLRVLCTGTFNCLSLVRQQPHWIPKPH